MIIQILPENTIRIGSLLFFRLLVVFLIKMIGRRLQDVIYSACNILAARPRDLSHRRKLFYE
jgi:hypothetical protein